VDTSLLESSSQPREEFFRRFYWRRFLRIFPPYYVVLGLVFATLHREQWSKDWAWYVPVTMLIIDSVTSYVPGRKLRKVDMNDAGQIRSVQRQSLGVVVAILRI
jgi:peptidoglycan/LPS O-acetylase OafA/YrhL